MGWGREIPMARARLDLALRLGRLVFQFLGVVGLLTPAAADAVDSLLAGSNVAAVFHPMGDHLEVFVVDADGVVTVVRKANNGKWDAPTALTAPHFVKPGASLAAAYYPSFKQLEAFVVDKDGVVNVIWKSDDGPWQGPVGLTDRGFAPEGAPLAVVYQPLNEQLEVFVVDVHGAIDVVWKANNSPWKRPFAMTGAQFADRGAAIAAAYYPTFKQLEVFTIDKRGVLSVLWKADNGAWHSPVGLTGLDFAPSGSPLTAVYQPRNEHLEVFTVTGRGAFNVIWKENNQPWKPAFPLLGDASLTVGAGLASVYYPTNEQLEVYFIDKRGAFNVIWKDHDGPWKPPTAVTQPHFVPGAPLAAAIYPSHDQVEAFTADNDGILYVEWKARNQAWVPCSFPLMGTFPQHTIPARVTAPTVMSTERLGQLTGSTDPERLPILNGPQRTEWAGAGVEGTDLGASTDHNGRLFIFFGDVVPGNPDGAPALNTDLVGWTSDGALQPGGFVLHPVKAGRFFEPFTVDSGIGPLPGDRTPTGAFSYAGRAYVFALWDDPADPLIPGTSVRLPTAILASKADPSAPGPYHLEFTLSKGKFWQIAPVVVHNADHPGLPASSGDGVVLLGGGAGDHVSLAWMRLDPERGPLPETLRYYTGQGPQPWTAAESSLARAVRHEGEAVGVIELPPYYTSVSALWREDAKQWVVLYSRAVNDPKGGKVNPAAPIVARFGATPWSWSEEVSVFDTCRDLAYGHFMHWSGIDDINARIPPDVWHDAPGWAYGAFVLQRFTQWNAVSHELSLAYLMSTSNPYQVQVMRSIVRLPGVSNDVRGTLVEHGVDFSVAQEAIHQWLTDSADYPAIAQALLKALNGKRLVRPVYLDVIVWNYEHAAGGAPPARVEDVDTARLIAAVLEGYNTRYGAAVHDFDAIAR